jgi:uncharacterized damage-inducible protein DinB
MKRTTQLLSCIGLTIATCAGMFAQTPRQPPTPAQSINGLFADLNRRVLDMAKDLPEASYSHKPSPDVRSFGEVIVHIASGNIFAAKVGRGENANWDELDTKDYRTKEAIVALLEKSVADATTSLKAIPADYFSKTLRPWLAVIEHEGEHYGQLVAYYREMGLVPPESRKNPSK